MLRDDSRNDAYQDGIRRAVLALEGRHGQGAVRVLDIGTGSGLLAMMACAAGAGGVTACECFAPVARSAAQCIADNGLEERIKLVARASTEMTQEDMYGGQRAHLLVPDARAAPVGVMMTHNNNVLSCALITTMLCSHVAMRERGRAHGRRHQARRRRRGGEGGRTGRTRARARSLRNQPRRRRREHWW